MVGAIPVAHAVMLAPVIGTGRCVAEAPRRYSRYSGPRVGRHNASRHKTRPVAETVLHSAWQAARTVIDRNGTVYGIIYAGIPGGSTGPDFRDVVIERPDGRIVRGDVEIHVRRSGWFEHGHHRDPAYNGVVFHVTLDDGPQRPDYSPDDSVTSAAGISIPLLLLKCPAGSQRDMAASSADGKIYATRAWQMSLKDAGDRRFFARSSGLSLDLRSISPDEVIWREVLECLGYTANRRAFRRLAERLPWRAIAGLGPDAPSDYIERVLLWAAGFTERPPGLGRALPALGGAKPEWASKFGRPDNRPERRIAGAAALAQRWLRAGGPDAALSELIGAAEGPKNLVESLTVPADPHRGAPHQEKRSRALIGNGRAAEISVNAVLPALHAITERDGRWHVHERALAFFRDHPKTPENAVTREMRRLLKERGQPQEIQKISTAREQQGLVYLYRTMTRPATV